MNWKELTGWTFILNSFVSYIFIVYLNMNHGWFYPFRNTSMLIPASLMVIGIIFLCLAIEFPMEYVLCDKCKTPVAISCTGYVHCVKCNLGNEDPWYIKNPGVIV